MKTHDENTVRKKDFLFIFPPERRYLVLFLYFRHFTLSRRDQTCTHSIAEDHVYLSSGCCYMK